MGSRRIIMDEDAMIAILHEGEGGDEAKAEVEAGEHDDDLRLETSTDLTPEG